MAKEGLSWARTVERGEPTLIPPAEETEKGLYFLSNLDHYFPTWLATVYCFKPIEKRDESEASEVIKNALSRILIPYYPVAGRVITDSDGRLVVDCTGEGAVFVKAQANCTIEEIGDDPMAMEKLVLYDIPLAKNSLKAPPLAVQVTTFKNGGFVVGITICHLIFDGVCAMEFINSWGEIARGLSLKVNPFLDRTILKARKLPKVEFPHHEYSHLEDISNTDDLYNEEIQYKLFCFDPAKVERVKMAAMEDGVLVKCSTFEALSGFVWRSRSQALKLRPDQKIKFLMFVDGRKRFDPPLPDNFFGNAIVFPSCITNAGELTGKQLSFAVGLIQKAITSVTDSYMRSAIDYLEVTRVNPTHPPGTLLITAWNKLSFNKTDFGFGPPFLTGRVSLPRREVVMFLSHPKEKKSINVLVNFPASVMKTFEELMDV